MIDPCNHALLFPDPMFFHINKCLLFHFMKILQQIQSMLSADYDIPPVRGRWSQRSSSCVQPLTRLGSPAGSRCKRTLNIGTL